ncbi:hypothetical protein DS909_02615 [Phaeobacter gallaeciensis]|uniref:BioF2-like acetyltransferase domain-containing protein n=2 Tax=Roseobacteraceae TaxID=2854170 RepID=A0A366XAR3_9RHOB|nr:MULTISPECIES: GNAT family N-acetyltransferase [Roseobacteraceae]MBT3142617.1 GNAT family N-acetyltransferase [Falsiruegeria litorea]MBT8168141.1 GNAT family N-acetyltransferase [Falsiruegeria litorea]RBW61620.1 hypothetical protein DS909_02615 [Phaeobacter gallaeciensis]
MDGVVEFPAERNRADPGGFRVDSIETFDGLVALKSEWQRLERLDPENTVFLSWDWLAQAFRQTVGRWRVLAVYHNARLVCVLPLKYRVHWSTTTEAFQSEIEAGGRLLWSEYTGFLCDPAVETDAIPMLSSYLRGLPWSRLNLRYVGSEDRSALFMGGFSQAEYSKRWEEYRINKGAVDNLSCPQIALPNDFDTYLSQGPSKNTRQKIRRFTRKYIESGELTFAAATNETVKEDLGVLLRFWMLKWSKTKGAEGARLVASNYLRMLSTAHRLGLLYLPVLRRGQQPIAALGHILDPKMKRVHFIAAGRDETEQGAYIGLLMHSQSIRWAIDQGYAVYDFCHGDEPYKFSFASKAIKLNSILIRRRELPRGGRSLDPLNHREALARVLEFVEAGKNKRAALGCRQLLSLTRPPVPPK